jgi:hypothetical protein
MAKILKNSTLAAVTVTDTGVTIPASSSYTIQPQDYLLWAGSTSITSLIGAPLIVNDGVNDLSTAAGLAYIKYPDLAENIRFKSDPERVNGFTAKDIQLAIEEAKSSSIGSIYCLDFIRQGASGNTWLYNGDSGIPSNATPAVLPFNCKLVSAAIASDSGNRNFDINVNVVKAGTTTIDRTIVYQVRNARSYTKTDFQTANTALNLSAGDRLGIYCQTQGAAPSDLAVTLGFKVISEANVTTTDNTAAASLITATIGGIVITIL